MQNASQREAEKLQNEMRKEMYEKGLKGNVTVTVEGDGVSYKPEKGNITEI